MSGLFGHVARIPLSVSELAIWRKARTLPAARRATALEKWLSPSTPRAYLQQLLSRQELLVLWSDGPAGSPRDCALRQSRNNVNARPKRGDRLLDHESGVRANQAQLLG
jgi:hypothetical protein